MSDPKPVSPEELDYFPYYHVWHEGKEFKYASHEAQSIVERALRHYMRRGGLPEGQTLRRELQCEGSKHNKAYDEALPIIQGLVPLWCEALSTVLQAVQARRSNGSKGGRPRKNSEPEPTLKQPDNRPVIQPDNRPPNRPTRKEKVETKTESPSGLSSVTTGVVTGDGEPPHAGTPYQRIEFALWGRAIRLARLNREPGDPSTLQPHERTVRSHLKGTTGLLPVIDRLGPLATVDVLVWVARHMPPNTSYLKVLDGLDVILSQMEHGQNWVVRNRAPQGGTPDLRGHLETDLFE